MRNSLRKLALPTTIAIFCAVIGVNAYLASNNLKIIQKNAAQRIDASDIQADLVAVELDLQAIETGQRGYLLTGDTSYLSPYTQAVQKLPGDLSTLRSRLSARPPEERAVESKVEAVAGSKIADANETIRLREKGYRHRAFVIVDSNRGKELMDKARSLLAELSAVETKNIAQYDRELKDSAVAARQQSGLANLILLALTVITLVAFNRRTERLEAAYAQQTEELRATSLKLKRFTSTISTSVRSVATQMRDYAESLLNTYGGFLPRQGQERVQWIHEGSLEINRLLDDLLEGRGPGKMIEEGASGTPDGFSGKGPHSVGLPDEPRSHTA